jgi:hypothetical protein
MVRVKVVVACLTACLGLLEGAGRAESPQVLVERLDIVDRAIEYHGGGRYLNSQTSLEVCSRPGCYEVSATVQGGRYEYRVKGPYRGGVREVLVNNKRVLQWQDGEGMVVTPDREAALRDWAMGRVYFCFLPYRLDDDSVVQEDLGVERWSGRELHKVKVTFMPGTSTDAEDEFLYWFDPASGRLEQFAYSFVGSPGGLRFRKLHNFRRIGGLLFFDQENWGAAGDELTVELINPDFVADMEKISSVELRNIHVDDPTDAVN